MSIAVSAVIRPSRRLRLVLVCYAASSLSAGLAIAVALRENFMFPDVVACGLFLAGTLLLYTCVCGENWRQIDISGVGQIRLTLQQDMGRTNADRRVVRLRASTVWPQMMVLRLGMEDGTIIALVVLPDSLERQQFRALVVAIRAVAGSDHSFFKTGKKL
jgi:toxin CptA